MKDKRDQTIHERDKRQQETRRGDERERPPRQRGTGYGRERAIYEEYLARRWQGSDPPTPQAYARALRQWRQLPGAVGTTATDLGTIPDSHPVDNSKHSSHKQAH
ncbi:MAG: hypothetical protein WA634_17740, partial [Silvibacterium sp.]